MRTKLLICTEFFKPGSKAGGIIEAAFNLSKGMSSNMDVYILTSDRDIQDNEPYHNIKLNKWNDFDSNIKVMYIRSNIWGYFVIIKTIRLLQPDSIFINGMFSIKYSIFLALLKFLNVVKTKVVLSPRGMLKETALQFKKRKKSLFLGFFKIFSIHKCLKFHATDHNEFLEIIKIFGSEVQVHQIFDLAIKDQNEFIQLVKVPLELKCLFIGRIHPIKNLLFFLRLLGNTNLKYKINFTIAGPIEDPEYWQDCNEMIKDLRDNVQVKYIGNIPNDRIIDTIVCNHLVVNPSQGENFGYSIVESLQTYRPVLIGDNTPWKNLDKFNAGWCLSLTRPDLYRKAIETALEWDQEGFDLFCYGAKSYIDTNMNVSEIINDYVQLLEIKKVEL